MNTLIFDVNENDEKLGKKFERRMGSPEDSAAWGEGVT